MKKNLIGFLLCIVICVSMVGCTNAIPELSEEDMNMVTEYAAALLLKYNSNYEPRMLNPDKLAEEEKIQAQIDQDAARLAEREAQKAAAKDAEKTESSDSSEGGAEQISAPAYTDVADFIGLDGFSVSYNGVDYTQIYPQGGGELFFSVTATNNCELAVIRLYLVNDTNEDRDVNLLDMNLSFKASFNDGSFHRALSTLLEDDFAVYAGTVPAGGSVPLVLIVDLPKDEAVNVNSLTLYAKTADDTAKIPLQ
ncbi:MAG: hypothetical protein K6G07_02670 [Lachnospiraceae bacterium]|nr:hypothetical protein [Lachnospiraceae bacterium]